MNPEPASSSKAPPPYRGLKRGLKALAYLLVLFFLLSCLGWGNFYVARGGELGFLTQPIRFLAGFPSLVKRSLTELETANLPRTYLPTPEQESVNELSYDLFGLQSCWNRENQSWDFRLFNFRDQSTLHRWTLTETHYQPSAYVAYDYFSYNRNLAAEISLPFPVARPLNSIVLHDGSLIVAQHETANLFRLNANSGLIWENHALNFHHALNLDADSNLWVCATRIPEKEDGVYVETTLKNINGLDYAYRDDLVLQLDPKDGKVLFQKGVADILWEHQRLDLLLAGGLRGDPIHLNDIEPILTDGPFWQKGDLLLSLRTPSAILLYRPANDSLLAVVQGPLLSQHDVDVYNEEEISVFNNRFITDGVEISVKTKPNYGLSSSGIVIYNFRTGLFRSHLPKMMAEEQIAQPTEGLHEILKNGDTFVEAQETGLSYVFNAEKLLLRQTYATDRPDYVHLPNWVRIYEKRPLINVNP